MLNTLQQPWPWWAAGIFIGLTVPALLLLGNKSFGLSSNLRHICAACFPGKIDFFNYDWKKESWNFFFVGGIILGGFIASYYLGNPNEMIVTNALKADLKQNGITNFNELIPLDLISWESLFTVRGFIIMVLGGFLVGFGTRYAGGCTSGHSIMGLANLQWPSLVATLAFMIGGIVMTNLIMPYILAL